MVVLSTNTGNCTVSGLFDATAGGVTLGTAAQMATATLPNSYE